MLTFLNVQCGQFIKLPFHFSYEERKRSLESVAVRHKDSNTYEEFAARVYNPIASMHSNMLLSNTNNAPLASALLDHQRSSGKSELNSYTIHSKTHSQHFLIVHFRLDSSLGKY